MEVRAQFPQKLLPGLFEPHRYKVIKGGRGSAKSWSVARSLLIRGTQKPLRILCARETQKSIRESVHRLLIDQMVRLKLAGEYIAQQVAITGRNKTQFVFAGLSDLTAESIKSFEGFDIVWVEEGQVVRDRSWTILIPTIRKEGSEIIVTFNPELDTDPTWKRFIETPPPDTWSVDLNWRDNPWFTKVLDDERKHALATLSSADYNNIWEGKTRPAVSGAIYAEEYARMVDEGRVGDYPHDPRMMVYPVFDLGTNNNMSCGLWQRAGSRMTCIEALHAEGRSLADWSRELRSRPYNWGTMFLPHDAKHGNRQTNQSDEQTMQGLGWQVQVLERTSNVNDDIRQTRLMFPTFFINKPKCPRLIESLKRYRRNVPNTTQEPTMPVHDEWSHDADMVRYANQAGPYMTNQGMMQLPPLKYPQQFRQA